MGSDQDVNVRLIGSPTFFGFVTKRPCELN
jgi:hypothetical protein